MDTESFSDLPLGTHIHYQTIDSTNSAAKRIQNLDKADVLPLLITCNQQTAGRGRGGNRWLHAQGNLAFSIVVDSQNLPAGKQHWIGLWTAFQLLKCAQRFLPKETCQLKWPNDLIINGRKNAGILLESIPGSRAIVCGIGMNLVELDEGESKQMDSSMFAWSEAETDNHAPGDAEPVLRTFLSDWLKLSLESKSQRQVILDTFSKHDWLSGKRIELIANGKTHRGLYAGLSEHGFLKMRIGEATGPIQVFASCDRVRPID